MPIIPRRRAFNIFTPLIIAAAVGVAFRAANIAAFRGEGPSPGVILTASAETEKRTAGSEPPPISQAEVEQAVKDAARGADAEGARDPRAASPPKPGTLGTPQPPSFSSAEVEVLQALAQRRDALDAQEKRLSEREALLKAAEQQVDRKVGELNKLKADMERLLGQQEKAESGRIASLVKIYENMKPKEAARIFDALEMDILLDVIGGMSERKVSPVLAEMNPEKAKDVTTKLAEQRKLPAAGREAVEKSE